MKIALLGYGKMGKMIEQTAISRNHEIVLKVDVDTKDFDVSVADVAIDFSTPSSAFNNINMCIENKVPVISGTTGWRDNYDEADQLCCNGESAFIYASHYCLGVNICFQLSGPLGGMMNKLSQYAVRIEEIHHTQKLDAPSGTAITL